MARLAERTDAGGSGGGTSNQQEQQQDNSGGGGSGMFSGVTSTLNDAYQGAAGVADNAAGSTDEAVARQFDNEDGGGVADGLKSFTGATAWQQSEEGQELREEYQSVEDQGDGVLSGLTADAKRFDTATKSGLDFLLDNPNASVQDTLRGGLQTIAGEDDKEEFAEGLQNTATNYSEATSGLLEDTPLDNAATDAGVWAFDALVADPAKAGLTAATGVDIDKGTSEGNVGAIEAADIGLTIGTAGAGKAAFSGVRGALGLGDEALSLGDEAAGAISRWGSTDEVASVADDAAGAADDAVETVTDLPALADDAADSATTGRFADFLGSTADDAAGAADDAAGAADDAADSATTGRFADFLGSTGRTADDAAGAAGDAARAAADAGGSAASRVRGAFSRFADEFGSAADDAAEGAAKSSDDADGWISGKLVRGGDDGFTSGKLMTPKTLGLVGGGFLAGGAATTLSGAGDPRKTPDEITTESGKDLTAVKTYKPVEKYPNGGKLFAVTENYQNIGYWLLLGVQGRTLYVLDSTGEPRQARINAEQFSNMMSTNGGGQ